MAEAILIYPEVFKRGSVDFKSMNFTVPMGILSIASYVNKKGLTIALIDCRCEDDFFSKLDKTINKNTQLIGLSVMTVQIKPALEISRYIKKKYKNIKIVWGGAHPTFFPEQTIKNDLVDYVIVGEGEKTFLKLIKYLKGEIKTLKSIEGLAYKEKGKAIQNRTREPIDMNKLPYMDYSLVDAEKYINKTIHDKKKRVLELNTSRGCPHRCTYCINTSIHKRKWRSKDAESLLDEIEFLIKKYNVNHIHFLDENFFVNKKRIEDFCKGVKKRKIKISWQTNVRVDYFKDSYLAGPIIKKIQKSGCIQLNFGAESGSDRILKFIKKDATVKQLLIAIKTCEDNNIIPNCSFMVGLPTETKKDILKTVNVIKKIKDISSKAMIIGPQIFRPYPGCELFDYVSERGFTVPEYLEAWVELDPLLNTGYVSLDDLFWIKDKEFVEAVSLYTPFATQDINKNNSAQANVMIAISKIRWKTDFWKYPYEYRIFSSLKNKILSLKK